MSIGKITRRTTFIVLGLALTACGKKPGSITEIINSSLQSNSGIKKSSIAVHIDKTFTGKVRANMSGSITFEDDVTNRLEPAFKEAIRMASLQVVSYTKAEVGTVDVQGTAGEKTVSTNDFNEGKPLKITDARDLK